MSLNEQQEQLCEASQWGFSDLNAIFLNCTLKRSPELVRRGWEWLLRGAKQLI
jgi:hypothetical protein